MLTKQQIEQRVLAVAQRVARKENLEDHYVEAKTDWPEPAKAARLIAGHANSACPEEILWIIGLKERPCEITGAQPLEFSNWWTQVKSCFNGLAPSCRELIVPYDEVQLVALLFETDRAPYVVKNPAYNKPDGGPIEFEVPWRNEQSTRTATRTQLLQILAAPAIRYPDVEILTAGLTPDFSRPVQPQPEGSGSPLLPFPAHFSANLYFAPLFQQQVVFPFHRNLLEIRLAGLPTFFSPLRLEAPPMVDPRARQVPSSLPIVFNHSTSHELILVQPGFVSASVDIRIHSFPPDEATCPLEAIALLHLQAVGAPKTFEIEIPLGRSAAANTFSYTPPP